MSETVGNGSIGILPSPSLSAGGAEVEPPMVVASSSLRRSSTSSSSPSPPPSPPIEPASAGGDHQQHRQRQAVALRSLLATGAAAASRSASMALTSYGAFGPMLTAFGVQRDQPVVPNNDRASGGVNAAEELIDRRRTTVVDDGRSSNVGGNMRSESNNSSVSFRRGGGGAVEETTTTEQVLIPNISHSASEEEEPAPAAPVAAEEEEEVDMAGGANRNDDLGVGAVGRWRRYPSLERALLSMENPQSAVSFVKIMTVCNLGSLLFLLQTATWWLEVQRPDLLEEGVRAVAAWQVEKARPIPAVLGGMGAVYMRFVLILWDLMLYGPVRGGGGLTRASGAAASSSDNLIDSIDGKFQRFETWIVWMWLLCQIGMGAVKLGLRVFTLWQCRWVMLPPRRGASEEDEGTGMGDEDDGTANGSAPPPRPPQLVEERPRVSATSEAVAFGIGVGNIGPALARQNGNDDGLEETVVRRRRDRLARVLQSPAFRVHAAVGRLAQILVVYGLVLYFVRGGFYYLDYWRGAVDGPHGASDPIHSTHRVSNGSSVLDEVVSGFGTVEQGKGYGLLFQARRRKKQRSSTFRSASGLRRYHCSVSLDDDNEEEGSSRTTVPSPLDWTVAMTLATVPTSSLEHTCYPGGLMCWRPIDEVIHAARRFHGAVWAQSGHHNQPSSSGVSPSSTPASSFAEMDPPVTEYELNTAILLEVCCTNLIVYLFRALLALGVVHFHVVQERRATIRRQTAVKKEKRGLDEKEMKQLLDTEVFREVPTGKGNNNTHEGGIISDDALAPLTAQEDRSLGGDVAPQSQVADHVCSICLESFEDGELLTVLPCDARHRFHGPCIREWLVKCSTCPLCQGNLRNIHKRPMKPRSKPKTVSDNPSSLGMLAARAQGPRTTGNSTGGGDSAGTSAW